MTEDTKLDIIATDVYDVSGQYLGCIAELLNNGQGETKAILELLSPFGDRRVEAPWSLVQGYDKNLSGYVITLKSDGAGHQGVSSHGR